MQPCSTYGSKPPSTSKSNRERGSPCLNPLLFPKKFEGLPLIKMENLTIEMQHIIHFLHLSENPHCCNIYIRKPQFIWSNAFSTSNLHTTLEIPVFNLLSIHSEAIKTESKARSTMQMVRILPRSHPFHKTLILQLLVLKSNRPHTPMKGSTL